MAPTVTARGRAQKRHLNAMHYTGQEREYLFQTADDCKLGGFFQSAKLQHRFWQEKHKSVLAIHGTRNCPLTCNWRGIIFSENLLTFLLGSFEAQATASTMSLFNNTTNVQEVLQMCRRAEANLAAASLAWSSPRWCTASALCHAHPHCPLSTQSAPVA